MIDKQLISQCIDGNRIAYGQMYNSCIGYVYSTVKRYMSNEDDIKDNIQECFAKIFDNLDQFDSEKGTWNTWIRKIAVNQCLMHIRKNKNLSLLNPIDDQLDPPSSDDLYLDSITREDIDNMLENMPDGYKLVFMMYILDGYDHSEIATALNITKETSRSQLNRAKKWLKKNIISDPKFKAYGLL